MRHGSRLSGELLVHRSKGPQFNSKAIHIGVIAHFDVVSDR